MSLRGGGCSPLHRIWVFSQRRPCRKTAGVPTDGEALKKIAKLTPSFLAGTAGGAQYDLGSTEHKELQQNAGLPGAHRGHAGAAGRRVPWEAFAIAITPKKTEAA